MWTPIFFFNPNQSTIIYMEVTSKISELVDRISNLYRDNLQDCKASGRLENFTTQIDLDNKRLLVTFLLEDYWRYVEYGRRAGKMPPISAIENWIKIKPIIPDPINNKIPDTRQLAYLIARKIGREGTPAQRPLERALYSDEMESLISAIKQEITSQIYKYITSDEIS